MSGFDHRSPEVARLMHERALERGAPPPLTIDWQQLVDAFKPVAKAFADFGAALIKAMKPLLDLMDDITPGPTGTTPANARRHGHASTCPRHGPTKGGLCRPCVRGR